MRIYLYLTAFVVSAFLSSTTSAQDSDQQYHIHETNAPIMVMGDHIHHQGEWMFSYRYMEMHMSGNSNKRHDVSRTTMLQRYMVMPKWMNMQMHMYGMMYAPDEDLTLSLMAPYILKEMKHTNRMGVDFLTRSQGLGDVKVGGLYSLYKVEGHNVHVNFSVSLPTGSIDKKDNTLPSTARGRLPYPMQLGSGTVDLLPGLTYIGQAGDLTWSAQSITTLRLGKNRHGYRLGNREKLTAWLSKSWSDTLSQSVRLDYNYWENITGRDYRLNPNMVATAEPDRRGGKRVDLLLGVNWTGLAVGHELSFEVGVPIEESLSGPQLSTEVISSIGWKGIF